MSETKWEVLEQVSGAVQAEVMKGLLVAQGIQVVLSQEGIGESIYPVSVGPLSEIQLLVPASQMEEARKLLDQYYAGDFENLSYPDSSEGNSETTTGDQG